jgi:Helix-turn-helix of insertion element transposase
MNETEQNGTPGQRIMADETLTTKQLKAIPKILAARTYEDGCKAANISKTTFYTWMQDEAFKAEFERQRDELVETAFSLIAQNVEKAVSALVGLLDTTDDRVKRLTANDIIDHFLKHKELAEFEERIAAVEERLEAQRELG